MNRYPKRLLYLPFAFIFLYTIGTILLPQVAILNSSDKRVVDAKITISDTDLEFWSLNDGDTKEHYYSIFQKEGKYRYHFALKNNITLSGECGDIKNFEFGKRVIFLISDDKVIYDGEKQVVCQTFDI
jgi:hypothetical protein